MCHARWQWNDARRSYPPSHSSRKAAPASVSSVSKVMWARLCTAFAFSGYCSNDRSESRRDSSNRSTSWYAKARADWNDAASGERNPPVVAVGGGEPLHEGDAILLAIAPAREGDRIARLVRHHRVARELADVLVDEGQPARRLPRDERAQRLDV